MEHYIGMDAHSKTSMFVVVDPKGKETQALRINTSETEILKFIGSLKGKKHLTFEECQLARWLHVVIKDQVDDLVVCNPCFIAKRKGPKNDYLDALHLAQHLQHRLRGLRRLRGPLHLRHRLRRRQMDVREKLRQPFHFESPRSKFVIRSFARGPIVLN